MAQFTLRFASASSTIEEARAEAQLLDVASGHASMIRLLHFYLHFKSCAGLKIRYPSLIQRMFPLHVSDRSTCKYFVLLCRVMYCRDAIEIKVVKIK